LDFGFFRFLKPKKPRFFSKPFSSPAVELCVK